MTILNGVRVLLVEDELIIAMQVAKDLTDAGCIIMGPYKGVDGALKAVGDKPVDIAVLDVNLGGRLVYPVAEVLAQRGVPFIFTTGYDRKTLPPSYADRPVIRKPIERSALFDILADTLGQRL